MKERSVAAVLVSLLLGAGAVADAAAAEAPHEGVWEGRAECADGPRFYRLSIEPGEKENFPRVVTDFLDGPGGQPWARGIGSLGRAPGSVMPNIGLWVVLPFAAPQWVSALTFSENGETATARRYGDCQGLTLQRMPREAATGDIASAQELPKRLVGRIGCDNGGWQARIDLMLAGDGETGLDATLTWPNGSRFSLFEEFDPETGTVTLVGDRWIERRDESDAMFDFKGVLRDRGKRLVARASWSHCGLIDVAVPGTGVAARVARPLSPRPILEWDDAYACATLIEWAAQALPQIGGKSFHTGITIGESRKIAVGLFADSRFVPFFGKPFEEVTDGERKHLVDLARYCERLDAFGEPMRHNGAHTFVVDFFSGTRPELALVATRYRMMQGRLAKEMRALEATTVGETDIPDLEARLGELDTRFGELWEADVAAARTLIERKLEAARGAMAKRLETAIAALPREASAFAAEAALRADIAAPGEGRRADQERLGALLDAQLGAAADALLSALVEDLSTRAPTLATLETLRTRLNALWPRLEGYVARDGAAFTALRDYTGTLAAAAFPEFERKVSVMMVRADSFAEKETAYADVVRFYQRTIPNADELGATLARYAALVESLHPQPTAADLIAPDGSPTNLAIKIAMARWPPAVWSSAFTLLPYDLSFVTRSIRVSSVRKIRCEPAADGGHWCDYDLRLDGEFPFLDLLSLVPLSGRFVLQGDGWALVETPAGYVAAQDPPALAGGGARFWSDYYQRHMLDQMETADD